MCLRANLERRYFNPVPERTNAWKIVTDRRTSIYRHEYQLPYSDGSTHEESRDEIEEGRTFMSNYHQGLHVYTSLNDAVRECNWWSEHGQECVVLLVIVDPDDWVAEDTRCGEAVYARLVVVGEVQP
jgi:hypothetical protein